MIDKLSDLKEEFLIKELLQLTLNAGLQTRNEFFPIYSYETLDLNQAKNLRNDLKKHLLTFLDLYKSRMISEEEHILIIVELSNIISKKYNEILYKKRFRIGISQKIINLFLKYMWIIGKINAPIHCPFDNIIKLKLLKGTKDINLSDWTEFDDIKNYLAYVDLAKEKSTKSGCSIAVWELNNWKRR